MAHNSVDLIFADPPYNIGKNFNLHALGIKIIQEKPLEKYPLIKCNVAVNGDKIYHLPFDQQYDRTLIKNAGEFYALTVKEAKAKGFRRAFRWKGVLK